MRAARETYDLVSPVYERQRQASCVPSGTRRAGCGVRVKAPDAYTRHAVKRHSGVGKPRGHAALAGCVGSTSGAPAVGTASESKRSGISRVCAAMQPRPVDLFGRAWRYGGEPLLAVGCNKPATQSWSKPLRWCETTWAERDRPDGTGWPRGACLPGVDKARACRQRGATSTPRRCSQRAEASRGKRGSADGTEGKLNVGQASQVIRLRDSGRDGRSQQAQTAPGRAETSLARSK